MRYIQYMNAPSDPPKYLTVRNLPPRVSEALETEKRRQQTSLNQTVIDLLRKSLGIELADASTNGLRRLAGSWSGADLERFEEAVAPTEQVDPELWR